jgi:uncharacterized membrane protein YedE/YeeE
VARSHDFQLLTIGTVCAAVGVYFVAVGCGVAPPPSKLNGPQWLATCIGLVFMSGGVMVLVRGWLGIADSQDLPDDAPRALIALQWLAVVACCAGLASAATWVAFGEGTRHFVMPLLVWGSLAEYIGRAAFGLGALIAWFITAAFAHAGARRVFGAQRR